MAFARFGQDSDVYVYEDSRGGFTCERCPNVGEEFRCATATEMVATFFSTEPEVSECQTTR